MLLKRALLLVDRGSREPEVQDELAEICRLAKEKGAYDSSSYCFLEVIPPFIEEGLSRCLDAGAEQITVVPYFLYPGMKLKDTVKRAARIGKEQSIRMALARPLCYHPLMPELVSDRISALKSDKHVNLPDRECDILIIGHGSSDRNAHDAFVAVADALKHQYRQVHHCFLELDSPDIRTGIAQALAGTPQALLMMPYFLHKGAHIKRDVANEVENAMSGHDFKNAFMASHLGVDEKLVDLVIERALEVEERTGFRQ